MKVNIGPYGNEENGFEDQEVFVQIDDYDTWSMDHTLSHIILPMLKQLRETKHGAPQVDYEDTPEELHPNEAEIESYKKDGTTDIHFFARWDYCLDEMIWAFEQKMVDNWEQQYYSGESDRMFIPLDKDHNPLGEARYLLDSRDDRPEGVEYWQMVAGPNDTFTIDWEGRQKHQDRMSRGFRLFGKYYENLWD